MPNLSTSYVRYVQGFQAVGADQTKIYGRRSMKFHFEQLVAYVWKAAVIQVIRISQSLTDNTVQFSAPVSFLIISSVGKAVPHESFQAFKDQL